MDKQDEIQIVPTDKSLPVPGDAREKDETLHGSADETDGTVKKRRKRKNSGQSDSHSEPAERQRKRRRKRSEGISSGDDDSESLEASSERQRRKRRAVDAEENEGSSERPRRKRRSAELDGAEVSPERPHRKRRSKDLDGGGGSPERPRRKRRSADLDGGESSQERSGRKRRSADLEGSESGSERPRRKRRSADLDGGESSQERPRRKRRSADLDGGEGSPERPRRKRSAESTESGARRRRNKEALKTRTEEIRTRRRAKKRTYMDVLRDLVVDNSLMAWIIKGLFCLLLFVIVLFVVRGIRNKGKGKETTAPVDTESVADESGLAVELTDLQKKTQTFLEDGAAAVDDNSITILGVGDNLVHEQVFLSAKTADGYDFRPFYTNVKKFISSADLATVNQETPLATALGEASGYPHFNTPTEMGDALIDTGFDVANMGNNHMLDMGIDGAYVTREYWDDKNIPCTGFYYGYDDLFDFRIIEKNGIKVAFLSFVEMTNDELPSGYNAIIAYMNDGDLVKSMLEEAKEKADIVVVHAHWGDENTDMTTDYVYNEAQRLVDWGADIVFGNHSHVLQDLVTLTRESDGQKCPVIYSLGNFFSAQKVRDQLVSGMLNVQVTKDTVTGKVKPTAMGFLPIVTHYTGDRENLMLYPLSMYSQEMAQLHGTAKVSSEGMPISMDYIETLLAKHIPAQYLGRMGPIQQDS